MLKKVLEELKMYADIMSDGSSKTFLYSEICKRLNAEKIKEPINSELPDELKKEHWLSKELDKINIAIDAVRKINPIDSVVFPVDWYRETMIILETIKSDTCKRMGIEYDGNSVLRSMTENEKKHPKVVCKVLPDEPLTIKAVNELLNQSDYNNDLDVLFFELIHRYKELGELVSEAEDMMLGSKRLYGNNDFDLSKFLGKGKGLGAMKINVGGGVDMKSENGKKMKDFLKKQKK